jgi:hypothetical protein
VNTKNCAELWQVLVARKLIHIAKFGTGHVRGVESLWEREFGLIDFILQTVSCWPRECNGHSLPTLGLADSVFCIVHLHREVTLKQLIKLSRLYFDPNVIRFSF